MRSSHRGQRCWRGWHHHPRANARGPLCRRAPHGHHSRRHHRRHRAGRPRLHRRRPRAASRTLSKPTWNTGTVGANNALVFRWLDAARFPFNLLLRLDGENDSQPFGWSIGNGELRILLTTNSQGDVTETAAGLITKIAAEATLSRFLSVSHATGSSGAGLLVPVAATPTNLAQSLNPIGVAEGSASAAGDLVEILLTP